MYPLIFGYGNWTKHCDAKYKETVWSVSPHINLLWWFKLEGRMRWTRVLCLRPLQDYEFESYAKFGYPFWNYLQLLNGFNIGSLTIGYCPGSLLGYPSTCEYRGLVHSCTLSLACWLVGGTLSEGCGGDLLADWLFTCCVVAGQQPIRRWGLRQQPPLPTGIDCIPIIS